MKKILFILGAMIVAALPASAQVVYPNVQRANATTPLTSTRVTFADSAGRLTEDSDLTFATDTLSATKVAMSSLTSGRVPFASTAGLLVDASTMTFSGGTLTLGTGLATGTGTFSSLTTGRVPFVSTAGLLVDASTMTFSSGTLTLGTGVSTGTGTFSSLTPGRVTFASTNGLLADDTDLTFATDTLSATKVAMSSLTSGRVPFATTAGLLVDDADLTFATDTLTATKGTFGSITHIANAIAAANSVTSVAGSALTLGTGTSGTALTIASANNLATFGYNSNADIGAAITNASSGNAASAYLRIQFNASASTTLGLYTFGSGRSASGLVNASMSYIATASGQTNGLTIATETTAPLVLATNSTAAITIGSTQNVTLSAAYIGSTDTRSGPGEVSVTKGTTKVTTTGLLDALTLADGVDGQIKRVVHDVDGGSFVLTPTTKTGWTTYTSTVVGETISMQFVTTRGWLVIGSYLGTIAP